MHSSFILTLICLCVCYFVESVQEEKKWEAASWGMVTENVIHQLNLKLGIPWIKAMRLHQHNEWMRSSLRHEEPTPERTFVHQVHLMLKAEEGFFFLHFRLKIRSKYLLILQKLMSTKQKCLSTLLRWHLSSQTISTSQQEQSVFLPISSDAAAFSLGADTHICCLNWFLVTVKD